MSHSRSSETIQLTGIVFIGALLRLYQIGAKGLWLDEAFSIWLARQPWRDMLDWIVQIDQHPPLYYALLHAWIRLGDGEVAVRTLSALASILTIPVMFALGKRIAGSRVGLLAALILALSPFHVRFAQEARMYALLTLNASLAMLALVHLLADPEAAERMIGQQLRRGLNGVRTDLTWFAYIVFSAATLLCHHTAILFVVAANAFMLGYVLFGRRGEGKKWPLVRNWLLAQLSVFLLWSSWLVPFIAQARGVYQAFWIPAPTLARVGGTLRDFASAFMPDDIGWGHAIWSAYVALLGLGIWGLRKRWLDLWLLLALFLIPFVSELLVSLVRPIFYERTLIWTTIPVYLLLAAGLCYLRRPPAIAAVLVILVGVNTISLWHYFVRFEKEQWDDAASYVAERVQEGDLLLFNATWVQIPFDYYLDRLNRPVEEQGVTAEEHGVTIEEHGVPVDLFERGVLEPKMEESDLPRLRSLIQGRRVWLIYSHDWYSDPQRLIPRTLDQVLRLEDRRTFYGLQVYVYAP